jgi:hypothetical protein
MRKKKWSMFVKIVIKVKNISNKDERIATPGQNGTGQRC